ncbi:Uncharacterised protein [Chlamydia trachomatis]|nr:Uncharacterised protein [Chlamydia trachomatis]
MAPELPTKGIERAVKSRSNATFLAPAMLANKFCIERSLNPGTCFKSSSARANISEQELMRPTSNNLVTTFSPK